MVVGGKPWTSAALWYVVALSLACKSPDTATGDIEPNTQVDTQVVPTPWPQTLSETGLFADEASRTLASSLAMVFR